MGPSRPQETHHFLWRINRSGEEIFHLDLDLSHDFVAGVRRGEAFVIGVHDVELQLNRVHGILELEESVLLLFSLFVVNGKSRFG